MIIPSSAAPICSLKQVRIEEIICELYFNKFSSKLENSFGEWEGGAFLAMSTDVYNLAKFIQILLLAPN